MLCFVSRFGECNAHLCLLLRLILTQAPIGVNFAGCLGFSLAMEQITPNTAASNNPPLLAHSPVGLKSGTEWLGSLLRAEIKVSVG